LYLSRVSILEAGISVLTTAMSILTQGLIYRGCLESDKMTALV
jgi:hypothetical protein